jgi:hypothetical protein
MPHKDPLAAKAAKRAYYLAHRDEAIARSKQRRLKLQQEAKARKEAEALIPKPVIQRSCVDCSVDITFVYNPKHGVRCKSCVIAYHRAYREANAERIAAKKAAWKLVNKDYVAARDKAYAEANPEKKTIARKKWIAANPGKNTAAKALNEQKRNQRIPTWLSEDDKWMVEQAYELAAMRSKMFGFKWHVDHIIPLNGKRVSGLHVPTNLQVVPWIDNLKKYNKFEVTHV